MSIKRIARRHHFTIKDSRISNDFSLTLGARGLLDHLLAQSDCWEISQKDLEAKCIEGKHLIRKYIHELIDAGYIERKKRKNKDGKFSGYDSIVHEEPIKTTSPKSDLRSSVDQPLININNNNYKNKTTNVVLQKKRKSEFPKGFSVKQSHQELVKKLGITNIEAEAEAFKDFHLAKGSAFKDWDRAFNTWLRNSFKFGIGRSRNNASNERNYKHRKPTAAEVFESSTSAAD